MTSAAAALDASGDGHAGSYSGTLTLGVASGLADGSTAASFTAGKVEIPHAAAWNSTTLTCEAWANIPMAPGAYQVIVGEGPWTEVR